MTTSYQMDFTDSTSDPGNKDTFTIQPFTTNGPLRPTELTLDPLATAMDTTLLFSGKGTPNYGERLQENLLHLLENFCGGTAPILATKGQLWYQVNTVSTDESLTVYDGSSWKRLQQVHPTQPITPIEGEVWYDTAVYPQLKVYNNTAGIFLPASGSNLIPVNGSISTTNGTATAIITLGLTDETTYHIRATVAGVKQDGSQRASYEFIGTFYRTGSGVATQLGSITIAHSAESTAGLNATFGVSGNNVQVLVTGINPDTYDWRSTVQFLDAS